VRDLQRRNGHGLGRTPTRDPATRPRRPARRRGSGPRGADAIVIANLADFPAAALRSLGLEAVHPDDFLLDQLDFSPPAILQAIHEQAAHTKKPPLTPRDLITPLDRTGIPGLADEPLRLMATPLARP
jgi:hypothetical protein